MHRSSLLRLGRITKVWSRSQAPRIESCRGYATESSQSHHDLYDVVCVGGGPAGLSLLAGLRASPVTSRLKVALIEGQDIQSSQAKFDISAPFSNRCSSLTPTSVSHLKEIGAWSSVEEKRVQPYQEMQVWDGVSGASINFDWASPAQGIIQPPDSTGTIAYMIENNNLTRALSQRLTSFEDITLFSPARVDSINLGEDLHDFNMQSWPIVTLNSGQKLAARLLIGADGANSPVRNFAGMVSRGWDYNRHGVVATLAMNDAGWGGEEHKIAYQRFLPTGPIALLPLPGNAASLVWSTTPERATRLKGLKAEDFVAMVNAAFRLDPVELTYLHSLEEGQVKEVNWRESQHSADEMRIPKRVTAVQPGTVANFPLKMRHADTYTGERVALIGDAAHTIHPLAGQGLNQGQGDAASLVRAIKAAVEHGADIGSQEALDAYNRDRWAANNLLLGVVDKLHKLYQFESGPIVPLRSFGLSAVNRLPALKKFLMKSATGAA
ncbi:ubiquinone biosynthesis hydrox [Rhizodiscina lignyota]|uniref:Ubiquinone biosynthesis monooxygenase COQ6, mitochondrial n=1 Tax=Rhizodiscina lignyota TaxID=1504668 RepID=A0A9P4ICA5_9PEZI|nr:ubiquinone biosynthesis hydrox [Rhizodiscina lignyota]